MTKYYNPNPPSREATKGQGRKKNLYDKNSKEVFRLSRGKIDDFIACPPTWDWERRTGFEPATFSLGRRHSTAELPPQSIS